MTPADTTARRRAIRRIAQLRDRIQALAERVARLRAAGMDDSGPLGDQGISLSASTPEVDHRRALDLS